MSVAPITKEDESPQQAQLSAQENSAGAAKEALMILGVDRKPEEGVVKMLMDSEGILAASVVRL